jgi:DHA3 family tetracycline resistance protein-like MFS transporter
MMSGLLKRRWEPAFTYLFLNAAQSLLFSLAFTVNLIYQVSTANLTPLQLVLIGSVLEGTVLLFEVPTGLVADAVSRRLSILVGLGLTGVSFLIQGAFPIFAWIALSQVVWGVGYTFTSGATTAWVVDEIGEPRAGPLFLRETQISNLTSVAGILMAVVVGSLKLAWPLLISGGLFLVLTAVLALRMPETGFTPASRTHAGPLQIMKDSLGESAKFVVAHPGLRLLFTVAVLTGAASEGFDRLRTAHWVREVGFPTLGGLEPVAWLAGINLLVSLLAAIGARLMEGRVDLDDTRALARILSLFVGITAGCMVVFGVADGFAVALVGTLGVRVSRALGYPLIQTWMNRNLRADLRATVLSMAGQMDALGQVGGGPVIGWLGGAFSIRAAILASAGALLPAAALYRRWRQPPEAPAGLAS